MKSDYIFFGEQGLTTTSANHVANLAKESYQAAELDLTNATLYTTKVALLSGSEEKTLTEGRDSTFIQELPKVLDKIAKAKSLIAWLREAIKAKERLVKEIDDKTEEEICKELGINLPEKPKSYKRLDEDDVVSNWNIKQRNRYYYLNTVCATIGEQIHPTGRFSCAREDLHKILTNRHSVNGSGRDTIIYTKTPSVSVEEVDNVFFSLQKIYREYQSELNSLKHQIEVTLQNDDLEKSCKEEQEYKQYKSAKDIINAEINVYIKTQRKNIQSLKIVIPDSLKDIYNQVNELGK